MDVNTMRHNRRGRVALLPPVFLPPASYYALMSLYEAAVIDVGMSYDKRMKGVHRTTICDTHGPLLLTVPVKRPHNVPDVRWCNIGVSAHGKWWDVHRVALESAYGRTPYFEHLYPRFAQFFVPRHSDETTIEPVTNLDTGIGTVVRGILGIDTAVSIPFDDGSPLNPPADIVDDWRAFDFSDPDIDVGPYPQIRQAQFGYIPAISVIDLIFNCGPEAGAAVIASGSRHFIETYGL